MHTTDTDIQHMHGDHRVGAKNFQANDLDEGHYYNYCFVTITYGEAKVSLWL